MWQDNALWPGEAIVARLQDRVPELREVLGIDSYDPGVTQPRQLPAAVVLLDTLQVDGRNAMRRQTTTNQLWMVAVAVRSAARGPGNNASEFGRLLPQVVNALQGWVPDGVQRGFDWVSGPRPSYGTEVSYFPLMFSIPVVAGAEAAAA